MEKKKKVVEEQLNIFGDNSTKKLSHNEILDKMIIPDTPLSGRGRLIDDSDKDDDIYDATKYQKIKEEAEVARLKQIELKLKEIEKIHNLREGRK